MLSNAVELNFTLPEYECNLSDEEFCLKYLLEIPYSSLALITSMELREHMSYSGMTRDINVIGRIRYIHSKGNYLQIVII